MYAVQVNLVIFEGSHSHYVKQLPTFYLDERVQGIVSKEHAERIAREIVNKKDYHSNVEEVNISVEKI